MSNDEELQSLLDMDGMVGEIDGDHWYKIEVRQVPKRPEVPHGIKYSLTLRRASTNARIFGIDNAHSQTLGRRGSKRRTVRIEYDHMHTGQKIVDYDYASAMGLLEDFFEGVERHIKGDR